MQVVWGVASHTGRVRRVNQDSVLADPPVFAVADGMGGHAAGEVASAIAVDVLRSTLGTSPTTVAQLVNAVRTANIEILRQSIEDEERRGMGTTVSGLALVTDDGQEELAIVNVGDSRTYLYRDGELAQVTRDHTYVEDLVAAGEITAEAARTHPQRHILTRVLGVEPDVEVDLWIFAPVPGDRYLVCSDGLPNEVDDPTMADILREQTSPQAACDELVRLALEFGARDNVTVLVLDVLADGTGPPGTAAVTAAGAAAVGDAAAEAAAVPASGAAASPAPLPPPVPGTHPGAGAPGQGAAAEAPTLAGPAAATAAAAALAASAPLAGSPPASAPVAPPAPPAGGSSPAAVSPALDAALRPTPPPAAPRETAAGTAGPVGGWLGDHAFEVPDAPVPPETRPADVTVPVVHSLAEAPAAPAPAGDRVEAGAAGTGAGKRRRRRIGWATLVTLLALLVIAGVVLGGIVYYGRSGYFAGFADDGSVVVFQGRPDGVLWVQPTVEIVYPLQRDELAPEWQQRIDETIGFSSLDAADRWYQALSTNPGAVPALATTTTAPTTTVAPTTAAVPTAAPTAPAGSGP